MPTNILFVDDEPNILSGLRRQLRSRSAEWHMEFAPGGHQALEILAKQPFDVIVTDMRMPGIDGAELLARVRERWPAMVRIVLSGHSDREHIMRSVHEAHQYLAKPCDAATLQSSIERAIRLRRLIHDKRIIEAVSRLDHLPSLPALYTEITAAMRNEKLTLKEIGKVVEQDVALSAKILQVVNSAFFTLPRHIASPSDAAVVLGIDVLRALALGSKLFSSFEGKAATDGVLQVIWQSSQRVATCSREFATDLQLPPAQRDRAFMAGLLHEIGKVVLLAGRPQEAMDCPTAPVCCRGEDTERHRSNTTHGEIGAYLLGIWGLPDDIVASVAYHEQPELEGAVQRDTVAAVHLAVCLVHGREPRRELLEAIDAVQIYQRRREAQAGPVTA